MLLILYNLLWLFLIPIVILRLIFKAFKSKSITYLKNIQQRFGFIKVNILQKNIWIHAVSMGEVKVAITFINSFQQNNELNFVLTTTTNTGLSYAKKQNLKNVSINYTPFDFFIFIYIFIQKVRPVALIIVEKEIWPNIINIAYNKNIPIFLLNGRMSDKSLDNYLRFASFFKKLFNKFNLVLAQYKNDVNNFLKLGVKINNIKQTGNIKFDFPLNIIGQIERPEKTKIWLAASTRNEEGILSINAHLDILKTDQNCLLILIPRHPEYFKIVFDYAKKKGLSPLYSLDKQQINEENKILIVNELGKMLNYYNIANLAFVGGSLLPFGCQNIIEPISLNVPVIIGDSYFNFKYIVESLRTNQAITITNKENFKTELLNLLFDQKKLDNQKQQARKIYQQSKGSLQKSIYFISQQIDI